MIRSLKELENWTIEAIDGPVGKVEEFYLDDNQWNIRYVAVDSRDWLEDRWLLFSPRAFEQLNPENRAIQIQIDRETIRNSPRLERSQPFGRQQELDLFEYYRWPLDWIPGEEGGLGPGSLAAYPLVELAEEMMENSDLPLPDLRALHSTQEFLGFSILARDGSIGKVEDLLVEDESWKILYLIVDTGGLLTSRKVVISPNWAQKVDWAGSQVQVDLSQDTVRNSPEFDHSVPFEQDYETKLNSYYGNVKDR